MTNRERSGREGRDDWASQVPAHSQRRGPYEDYGWERGESVLPEFRDPSVHEMPYDRQRGGRPAGPGGSDRRDWSSGAMDAPGRTMMRNPYDYDNGQRGRFSGGAERRDFDYDRDYDQDRWRQSGQGYGQNYGRDYSQNYGRDYNQGYSQDYNQDRWRQGGQAYNQDRWRQGGQGYSQDFGERGYDRGFNQGYGQHYGREYDQDRGRQSFGRDYNQDRWRSGGQGYGGESYSSQNYGREYDQDRWRSGGQNYGGESYSMPASWSYTEVWLIPGPFTGRGPKGYQRSDDRMREDLCDRLSQHGQIDAGDIDVQVKDGEVTLSGTVDNRAAKRMAEDVAESVQGVREVHNQLRVNQSSTQGGAQSQPGTTQAQGHMQNQPGMQGQSNMQNQSGMSGQSGTQQRAVGGSESRENESR